MLLVRGALWPPPLLRPRRRRRRHGVRRLRGSRRRERPGGRHRRGGHGHQCQRHGAVGAVLPWPATLLLDHRLAGVESRRAIASCGRVRRRRGRAGAEFTGAKMGVPSAVYAMRTLCMPPDDGGGGAGAPPAGSWAARTAPFLPPSPTTPSPESPPSFPHLLSQKLSSAAHSAQ